MRKYTLMIFSLIVGLSMMSCGDDSGINIIDIGDDDDDIEGTIFSITFDVDGGDSFTFSVDMDEATIEGDDLPDWYEGDVFEFDPENHRVFIAGSFGGDATWNQPGTNSALRLSRAGRSANVTVEPGNVEYKFFVVIDGMDFEENEGWDLGEWFGNPNRRIEVTSGGEILVDFGDQPEEEIGDFPESLFVAGGFQEASGYGDDWSPNTGPELGELSSGVYEGYVWFAEAAEFKFTNADNWEDGDWGAGDEEGSLSPGGGNLSVDESGYFRFSINLNDRVYESVTTEWAIIGDATPGGWDADTEMEFDEDTKIWSITVDLEAGEFKFRANGSWDINVGAGGDEENELVNDGGNIDVDAAGNYTIEIDLNGTTYTYTITEN
jgi:hypothetical protein